MTILIKTCKQINSVISEKTSMLQVALRNLFNEKPLIEYFYEHGLTCTYREPRSFKTSE